MNTKMFRTYGHSLDILRTNKNVSNDTLIKVMLINGQLVTLGIVGLEIKLLQLPCTIM